MRPRPLVALVLALLAAPLLLGGCAPPKQYGGPIAVDHAGLARRLLILCRLEAGDEAARAACEPTASLPRAAGSVGTVAQTAPR